MASVVTALPPETAISNPTILVPAVPETSASAGAHAVPAREEIRMGRAASMGAGINWLTLGVIVAFHLGALAALFFFTWQRLAVMVVLYVVSINIGIGMCYHRLLTHRGYQVPKWLEYIMATCATLALEGGPIFWVCLLYTSPGQSTADHSDLHWMVS